MVLEESSNREDIFMGDDVPPADVESTKVSMTRNFISSRLRRLSSAGAETTRDELRIHYCLNGGPLRQYNIPFNRMPLQDLTRSLAFGDPRLTSHTSHSLIDLMSTMEAYNGRPLTQLEAEGVALHVSRRNLYTTAAAFVGIGVGGLAAFARRKTFKFPLRKPKPVERYDFFPLQRAPLLTGQYSRAAWHTTRGLAYVLVSWALILPFFEAMGSNAQAIHLLKDERTKTLAKEFSQSMKKAGGRSSKDLQNMWSGKLNVSSGPDTVSSPSDSSPPDPDSLRFRSYDGGTQENDIQDDYVQDDTSSSSSSRYPYSDGASSTDIISDGSSEFPIRSQHPSSLSGRSNRNSFRRGKAIEKRPTSDSQYNPPDDSTSSHLGFDNDETPPPAPGDQPSISPSTSSPSGSAWAHIRESASSNTSPARNTYSKPPSTPESSDPNNNKHGTNPRHVRQSRARFASARQSPPNGADENEASADSFSFGEDVQDSQLAKEQAQKEFDRMVEAERNGGEAATPRGGGRWGAESSWGRRREW